jgi:hypothetical protein
MPEDNTILRTDYSSDLPNLHQYHSELSEVAESELTGGAIVLDVSSDYNNRIKPIRIRFTIGPE